MLEKLGDSYKPEEEFKIHKIRDHLKAKCLDGSSPVYYYRIVFLRVNYCIIKVLKAYLSYRPNRFLWGGAAKGLPS